MLYPAWLDYMKKLETEEGELDELFGVTIKEDFTRRVRNQVRDQICTWKYVFVKEIA